MATEPYHQPKFDVEYRRRSPDSLEVKQHYLESVATTPALPLPIFTVLLQAKNLDRFSLSEKERNKQLA